MNADANEIKNIFLVALEKSTPAERAAFLDKVCAGNAALREHVAALLQIHDRPDPLLDQPAATQLGGEDAPEGLDFLAPSTKPGSLGRLGHYEVLEVVGRGGMGIVLRAFDEKLHRVVAIKVLAPALAASRPARQRFVREARAAAAVSHDNVIDIHAVEDSGPAPYLVMQFINGKTLQAKLDDTGPLPVTEILRIGLQIAEGLAAAHRHGLMHRDIKPANILLENGIERIKIADFGLARAVDDASLTQSGYSAGTPDYMSPEQAAGEKVDHRSDLFSLGSVLYSLCTGYPPFRASTTMAVLKRVCEDPPRPIREINPDIPEWLVAVVAKLQAKDPGQRFATAAEVVGLLSRCLTQLQMGADVTSLRSLIARSSGAQPRPSKRFLTGRRLSVAGVTVVGVLLAAWFTRDWWLTTTPAITDSGPIAPKTKPWQPRQPLTAEQLAQLPDPLDHWRREALPPGALSRISGDGPPELIGRLGDGPFRLPGPGETHWPAQSPNGRLLALPNGNAVILYDAETGAFVRALMGHTGRAFRGSFSSDGKLYACASAAGTIRIWDVQSGKEEPRKVEAGDHHFWTTRFAPGDKQILVAGDKGAIKVWDLAAGPDLKTLGEHQGSIPEFVFSPDRTRLASAGEDQTVKIWSWPGGELVKTLEGHREIVDSVAYSADGAWLASGGRAQVLIWDAATFQLRQTLPTGGGGVLAFTPDGQKLLTAPHHFPPGQRRAFERWDVKTGVRDDTFDVPGPLKLLVGGLSGDGRTVYLMSCSPAEPRLGAYDALTGKDRFPEQSQAGVVWSVAFSPDGRWLASAGNDGRVCLWDLDRRPAGEFVFPDRMWMAHTGDSLSLAFSPDGQLLASGGKDRTIRLWKVADGQEVHALPGFSFPEARLAFSPDGETLAAGSMDGAVNLWNVKSGQPQVPVRWHIGLVPAAAFSPDGRWLASGGFNDRTVQLVDQHSDQRVYTFHGQTPITGLAFSSDSQTIAAICFAPGPSLYLFDVASKKTRTFAGHIENVLGVAFHPAGNRVATASRDGTARLWDTAPGADGSHKFDFHRIGSLTSVAFTPSGRHLAVGLADGTVAILATPVAVKP